MARLGGSQQLREEVTTLTVATLRVLWRCYTYYGYLGGPLQLREEVSKHALAPLRTPAAARTLPAAARIAALAALLPFAATRRSPPRPHARPAVRTACRLARLVAVAARALRLRDL